MNDWRLGEDSISDEEWELGVSTYTDYSVGLRKSNCASNHVPPEECSACGDPLGEYVGFSLIDCELPGRHSRSYCLPCLATNDTVKVLFADSFVKSAEHRRPKVGA
jgi:hypothetical protein